MSKQPTFNELMTLCEIKTKKANSIYKKNPNKASDLALEGSIYLLKASKIALERAKTRTNDNVNE